MAMKPRTFRRVILLGSLVAVLLVGALGYFVVRPWQNQRQVDSMRTQGHEAYEAGDYVTATKLLGRYLNNTEEPDPQLQLEYARSRFRVQTSDGGYIRLAIRNYRNYLTKVPGDVEAAQELLPLLNLAGMHLEAKDLAMDLRQEHADTTIGTVRELITAQRGLDEKPEVIEALYAEALEHAESDFFDIFQYCEWLRQIGRAEDARALAQRQLEASPEALANQLTAYWQRLTQETEFDNPERIAELSAELAQMLGLDPQSGDWLGEPRDLSVGVVTLADRLFNGFGRQDLSLKVRLAAAQREQDQASATWAARRLYWKRDHETLMSLDVKSEEGEPNPDVLGYQILSSKRDEASEEEIAALREKLDGVVLTYRGNAWRTFLDGMDLLDEGDTVGARPLLRKALDIYSVEPTYYYMMGRLHMQQGRLGEAQAQWARANEIANADMVGNVGWGGPLLSTIDAYTRANRLPEAVDFVDQLVAVSPRDPLTMIVWLQSYASLARSNDLSRDRTLEIVGMFDSAAAGLNEEQRSLLGSQIATLYASAGLDDEARGTLTRALAASPTPQNTLELLDVDQRYDLGVARAAGIDMGELAVTTPNGALRHALGLYREDGEIAPGLELIDQGVARHGDQDPYAWGLTRAKYLDACEDERALAQWEKLRQANPDNIELLYEMAESNALRGDLSKVDEVIDAIVEKTSTAGQTLPSRLRLARASAIVGERPTRASRQQAIEIVRSVVASEQRNTKARNMLGRLLALKPSPALGPDETFEPDLAGAINQYVTLSRQLNGGGAQIYLLEAADLSFENNDAESARQYLREFDTRFPNDLASLSEIARRYENLGLADDAIEVYARVYRNASSRELVLDAGLALVDLYFSQDQRSQGRAMLTDLSDAESLSVEQLVKLASLHTKYGYKPEGEALAQAGARFGLSEIDAKMVYARYAASFVSGEAYIAALRDILGVDPTNDDAWKQLIRKLVRDQQYEQAQEALAQAREHIDEDRDLRALATLAKGAPQSASVLLESGAIESSPFVVEAVSRVDAYAAAKKAGSESAQQLIGRLTSMLEKFPEFAPVQRFALSELNGYPVEPSVVAQYAGRAARVMPQDTVVMRIAGNAYLRAGQSEEAIRIAQLWRANTSGATVEADAILARALIQLGRFDDSVQTLQPYIVGAISEADQPISQEVILAYSHAMLMRGEDPDATAARLEPLLAGSEVIRTRIWLNLATTAVPSAEQGAQWIRTLTPYAGTQEMGQIANAWVSIAERHRAWDAQYANEAIAILEPMVAAQSPKNAGNLNTLARAYAVLARSSEDETQRSRAFGKAIEATLQASRTAPDNLALLMQAASLSTESGDMKGAETHYRALLAKNIPPSPFRASVMNNLAMVIERQGLAPSAMGEARTLITQAVEMLDIATFWGTRGWVELAADDPSAAESSFRRGLTLDPGSAECAVGLAIALDRQGEERAAEADQAFSRVREIDQAGRLDPELRDRLERLGGDRWSASD